MLQRENENELRILPLACPNHCSGTAASREQRDQVFWGSLLHLFAKGKNRPTTIGKTMKIIHVDKNVIS
jgi:hypothetical protein